MGINDRDYVRRDGPSFLGAFVERGTICKWLIGANIVVYLIQKVAGEPFTDALQLDVEKVFFHGEAWRLLTHAFLHSPNDPLHIVFNMLFLWWFGADVEDLYGPKEFLAFYLSAALVAALTFSAAFLAGLGPVGRAVGASGAIMAVVIVCACHYPTRTMYFMFFLPMPLWVMALLYVGYDAYSLLGGREAGVGVAAHLGGAAFGFAYYRMNWRINPLLQGWWPSVTAWRRRAARPHLRVYREERPEPVRAAVASDADEDRITAEMDAVLEKISRVGRQNLTPDELEVLQRASEILRRRRT